MPYSLPTRIIFGEGSLRSLRQEMDAHRKISLFITERALQSLQATFTTLFAEKTVREYMAIRPEPSPDDLAHATAWLRDGQPDTVVAIGGGSVLDLAKAAALCVTQSADVSSILQAFPPSPAPSVPVIAIPTTAGTGSEVTSFTVFWDHQAKKKYSLGDPALYPALAIVDPELTYSMPSYVTATTGMDAFTQACEAYWNVNHNPTSDAFALEAIKLMEPALPRAVADGHDHTARHDMMLGSLRAGQAFSNTRTAACHSISYPMTLHYGVTHGQAVGITLPEVLMRNATAVPLARTKQFCEGMRASSMEEVAERIRAMMRQSGLKTRLSELGIDAAGIDVIVHEGFTAGRMGNNPYQFTERTLRSMLLQIK